ncbi:MAG: hypothetical protein LBT80_06105 [Lactobacillaceae bacterium]|nr:hypothetical protein [Lactobacillaceae bacterium]
MKHTTWPELLDHFYHGDEIMISYHNKNYFVQGYTVDEGFYLEVSDWHARDDEEWILFSITSNNDQEAVDKLINAKIFDGKNIRQAFDEAELVEAFY